MINLVVRGTCLINEKVKMNYNCRKFKIVSFPPQSKQIHDHRLGKEGLEGLEGGGGCGGKVLSEVVSKGLWQNYCMQPLCYFRLKIWFFFQPQSDSSYRLILNFTDPKMILSIMLHRLPIPKEKPPWNKSL